MSDVQRWDEQEHGAPSSPADDRPGGHHVEEQLAAYTAGELSEVERASVERHLAGCPTCRAALAETRRIRGLLASLAPAAAPGSVASAVLARLPAMRGDDSAVASPGLAGESPATPEGPARPVSPDGDVPSPVLRLEPRHVRGRLPSSGRRRAGATGRDMTAMERSNPTRAERPAPPAMVAGRDWQAETRPAAGRRPRPFAAVAAAVAIIALGAGIFGLMSHRPTLTLPSVGGQPHVTQPAIRDHVDLPANSQIGGVSMVSPNDGWIVGTVNNAPNGAGGMKNALLAHYDGYSWTTSPDSNAFAYGYLNSVSMVSANDGWATGSISDTPTGELHGLVLHYTGGHWRAVDISSTGFIGGGEVHMVSADEGWIYAPVGAKTRSTGQFGPDHKTLILHYQHGAWSLFGTLPGNAVVSMLSASDGWAIVDHAILRYQNGAWTQVAMAAGQPGRLTMVSPSEGWIAGFDGNNQSVFAMRFDGQSWSQMALPDAAHAEIDQIAVAAPGDIWFFGRIDTNTMHAKTVAWHYSAGQWTRVDLNFEAFPTGAAITSPTSGWLTGNGSSNSAALMRYDNGTWTTVLGN